MVRKALLLLIVIIFIGAFSWFFIGKKSTVQKAKETNQEKSSPLDIQKTIVTDITNEFSKKYNKSVENIIVTVDTSSDSFTKGSIRFSDEAGGAIWFGAKDAAGWKLVNDGQGPMECGLAEKYSFPASFVPECIDSNGNLLTR